MSASVDNRARTGSGPGRLLLRPWSDDDVEPLIASYRDGELLRWTQFHVPDEAAAAEWLAWQRAGWAAGERFSLVVEEMVDDVPRFVGNVALKTSRRAEGVAEVGYWTAPWARGRGVAAAAVIALSGWAFSTFPLARLELRHALGNPASCRVAEKAGYAVVSEPEGGHVHARSG